MTARETVELRGHIVDSLLLPKVLDAVVDAGADYRILDFDMGRTATDHSLARIEVTAADDAALELLLEELQVHGVNLVSQADAELVAADVDGVLPAGFYSTTNLPTQVRVRGRWVDVERPEMDCAVVVSGDDEAVARTTPMHRVERGDRVVVGFDGVRVTAP
jgi:hypothetical protein